MLRVVFCGFVFAVNLLGFCDLSILKVDVSHFLMNKRVCCVCVWMKLERLRDVLEDSDN